MGDTLRMKTFEGDDWWWELDYELQAIAWAMRTMIPSNIPYSSRTMAYQRDMIMQTKVKVDWEILKQIRKQNMLKNNIKENAKRIEHTYKVGDQVLIYMLRDQRSKTPKLGRPTEGPYEITKIYKNGTVEILRGNYHEKINIRRLQPYTKK